MLARTRKRLTIAWLVVLACMTLPFALAPLVNIAPLASVAWFAAIPVVFVTYRRVDRDQHLQRPGWYRAALTLQLVVAVTGVITAAHTVLSNGSIGLVSIATVQLAVAILTWRAMTRPDPRRAVAAAMVSGFVTFVALLLDITLDLHLAGVHGRSIVNDLWSAVAVLGVMLSWIAAGTVCLAVIRTFGEPTNLPDARAV